MNDSKEITGEESLNLRLTRSGIDRDSLFPDKLAVFSARSSES
jgi:hypothetical protein